MTQRIGIAAVAVVVALIVWFAGIWLPASHTLSSARARTATAEARTKELRLELRRLQAARKDLSTQTQTLEKLQAAVPDTPDLAGLLNGSNDAAKAAGVQLLSIAPTAAVAGSPTAIPFSLNVRGSWFSTVAFVQRLLAMPRLVVVDGVQASGGSEDGLTVSITARAFTTQAVPK